MIDSSHLQSATRRNGNHRESKQQTQHSHHHQRAPSAPESSSSSLHMSMSSLSYSIVQSELAKVDAGERSDLLLGNSNKYQQMHQLPSHRRGASVPVQLGSSAPVPGQRNNSMYEPPISVNDHSKDHLLFSIFHGDDNEEDTTTVRTHMPLKDEMDNGFGGGDNNEELHSRRSVSPVSSDQDEGNVIDLGISPLTSSSVNVLQREYDRDTWRMYNRILNHHQHQHRSAPVRSSSSTLHASSNPFSAATDATAAANTTNPSHLMVVPESSGSYYSNHHHQQTLEDSSPYDDEENEDDDDCHYNEGQDDDGEAIFDLEL